MNFVFFDTETTSRDNIFGQILEFSAVYCDKDLNVIEGPINLECRLRPHILPEPGALLVTKKTIEEINNREMSHYQMVKEIANKSKEWTPSIWIGWNSIEFDFKWLRSAFYQCLQNTYFHQLYGNKRADALTIARATHLLDYGKLNVPLNSKGKPTFKLEQISKHNSIRHELAHTADSDTLATLNIAKILKEKSPKVWDMAIKTTGREETHLMVQDLEVFISMESHYGTVKGYIMTFLCNHPIYKWPICIDLKVNPNEYLHLEGENLAMKIRRSPKVARTLRPGNHPLIVGLEHKSVLKEYTKISQEELKKRANLVRKNYKFKAEVGKILQKEFEEKQSKEDMTKLYGLEVEELMGKATAMPTDNDINWLEDFDKADWHGKAQMISSFDDSRFHELSAQLIFEESIESLPKSTRDKISEKISKRLHSKVESKWNTLTKTKKEIEKLRNNNIDKRDKNILDSLEKYILEKEKNV